MFTTVSTAVDYGLFPSDRLENSLQKAATVIRQGGVVALPTETCYGLAVDPFNEDALARLFKIKQRPLQKPILTMIGGMEQLKTLASCVPQEYRPLMQEYWPGPLTLLFPARDNLSPLLTANTATIGIRISSFPPARRLPQLLESPVTATSANISGDPGAKTAEDVRRKLGHLIDWVVDCGTTSGRLPSTVVGLSGNRLKLFRTGAIPFAHISNSCRI